MRAILQRVTNASVTIAGEMTAQIGPGLLVLLGIATDDKPADAAWLARKIAGLRIFSDAAGLMNLDLVSVNGDILLVSQFTLLADYKKGNRPSYITAARPEQAIPLYEYFKDQMTTAIGKPVQSGVFGADMKVSLVNDGPVTIMMDSKTQT